MRDHHKTLQAFGEGAVREENILRNIGSEEQFLRRMQEAKEREEASEDKNAENIPNYANYKYAADSQVAVRGERDEVQVMERQVKDLAKSADPKKASAAKAKTKALKASAKKLKQLAKKAKDAARFGTTHEAAYATEQLQTALREHEELKKDAKGLIDEASGENGTDEKSGPDALTDENGDCPDANEVCRDKCPDCPPEKRCRCQFIKGGKPVGDPFEPMGGTKGKGGVDSGSVAASPGSDEETVVAGGNADEANAGPQSEEDDTLSGSNSESAPRNGHELRKIERALRRTLRVIFKKWSELLKRRQYVKDSIRVLLRRLERGQDVTSEEAENAAHLGRELRESTATFGLLKHFLSTALEARQNAMPDEGGDGGEAVRTLRAVAHAAKNVDALARDLVAAEPIPEKGKRRADLGAIARLYRDDYNQRLRTDPVFQARVVDQRTREGLGQRGDFVEEMLGHLAAGISGVMDVPGRALRTGVLWARDQIHGQVGIGDGSLWERAAMGAFTDEIVHQFMEGYVSGKRPLWEVGAVAAYAKAFELLARPEALAMAALGKEGARPRKFTSPDAHVGELATELDAMYPGHVVGVNLYVNKYEVDIVLRNALIEVKGTRGASGLFAQLAAREEVTDLVVIGYGPNFTRSVVREAVRQGLLVTTDKDLLIAIVAPP